MRAPVSQIRLRSGSTRYSRVPLRPCVGRESRLRDIADENDLRLVVESFYAQAANDLLLADALAAVGGDKEKLITALTHFWRKLLLGDGPHSEGSCEKHRALNLASFHFERWVGLFQEVADAHFYGPMTHELKAWSTRLGTVFQK